MRYAVRAAPGVVLASAVALAAAWTTAQPVRARAVQHRRSSPPTVVRAEIVSGTPQTVHAYVAPAESKYVADFPQHLEVRIVGGNHLGGAKRRVKFACANPRCELYAPDQPEGGDRHGPSDYEIDAKDAIASLHVSIESDVPAGSYVVYAEPQARSGERSVRSGPFRLVSR